MTDETSPHRFMTPTQVADELNVKPNQVHALIKAGELWAFQVGGRGYRARLLRLMRILPGIAGEEQRIPREASVRFVSIVERQCATE